jgi:hypothetical protein
MRRIQIWSALAFSLLIVVGCKSTGSGTGASNSGEVQAHFTWQQSEATSGSLTAIVSHPVVHRRLTRVSSTRSRAIPR